MEDNPYVSLAELLAGGGAGGGPVLGTVTSWPDQLHPERPHRIVAEGNTQEREDLTADPALLPYGLAAGDRVLLWPMEERQRYMIICRVVEV